jgi:hypothetical protein
VTMETLQQNSTDAFDLERMHGTDLALTLLLTAYPVGEIEQRSEVFLQRRVALTVIALPRHSAWLIARDHRFVGDKILSFERLLPD